ncbi:hypothetical protein PSN45_000248 [Yamadazyma tenuis]|uniref:uncharacterized protein n=1 Tax=Candida tenuis TaxID=2315449 RepID=UPI002799B076|nr:hypothetical protein PSN45_000248 [Yamadazyma tenuis]
MLELNIPGNSKQKSGYAHSADVSDHEAYEQIIDMVKIPWVLEKFMGLGLMICTNSFLTLFTLVPIRIVVITFMAVQSTISEKSYTWQLISQKFRSVRRDVLTVVLILLSLSVLSLPPIDISKIYHDVRRQAQIKLYVTFGVLEVADKLCSSIGQNILGITFDLIESPPTRKNYFSTVLFFLGSVAYLCLHAYVLLYQTVSLNVAANSYSNALLTLLFSNQFSELRGSVFKKFDREGLFQLSMADLTERFQLSLMLGMITLRNILQLNSIGSGMIPSSWQTWNKWFGALFGPSIVVLGSEILVDWLKHCYISKFNRIKPRVYYNFIYVLALDYVEVFSSSSHKTSGEYELSDYTILTRRIGLPLLATTVCYLRMSLGNFVTLFTVETSSTVYSVLSSVLLMSVTFVILLLLRLMLGIALLKVTNAIKVNHENKLDEVHDSILETSELMIPEHVDANSTFPSIQLSPTPSLLLRREGLLPEAEDLNTTPLSPLSPVSPQSPIPKTAADISFLPGLPNTEMSTINPATREFLYDNNENIPPTPEEKRNKDFIEKFETSYDEGLGEVQRYEMSSKRIW